MRAAPTILSVHSTRPPKAPSRTKMGVVASIPEDVLDKAACWLKKEDLLRLREISPKGRDAARRAIARKAIPDVCSITFERKKPWVAAPIEMQAPPRAVEAMANVFGAGCVDLYASGTSAPSLAALYDFVSSAHGLRELSLFFSGISSDLLLVMCRALPNLIVLHGPSYVPISDEAIVAIAAACPRLEVVSFSDVGTDVSPAERYERHFPRLKHLHIYSGTEADEDPPYRPTQLENITAAARSTSATEMDMEGCHVFTDLIDAVVGTRLSNHITCLNPISKREGGMMDTNIEPDALLAAARGFPRLAELWIPELTRIPNPGWFGLLAGVRTFETVIIYSRHATDSQVVAACSQNPLVELDLYGISALTRGVIDGIISSQSAATLCKLEIMCCEPDDVDDEESYMEERGIRASDMLRLVRACPNLSTLLWRGDVYSRFGPSWPNVTAEEILLKEVLEGRGGELGGTFHK